MTNNITFYELEVSSPLHFFEESDSNITRELVYIKSTTIFQKRLKVHMMKYSPIYLTNKTSFYD